ncbi:hypothetical protein HYFRA_00005427 [Hymenoscyphus fraxineus]|uniref:Uncharacterized protein n=1 Tax=Hymenoscyphus fraxineus TaxID=746836 RepID=A0A9N9KU94_9HELO|nr:hypothetical protein HYFRA_00005427 [Hymenoscyphus fraxineus]
MLFPNFLAATAVLSTLVAAIPVHLAARDNAPLQLLERSASPGMATNAQADGLSEETLSKRMNLNLLSWIDPAIHVHAPKPKPVHHAPPKHMKDPAPPGPNRFENPSWQPSQVKQQKPYFDFLGPQEPHRLPTIPEGAAVL